VLVAGRHERVRPGAGTLRLVDITISAERPDSADAVGLITALDDELGADYPPESRHGYSVDKLLARSVTFFVVRVDGEAVGCGGVEAMPEGYGELKRMFVRPDHRGQGLAARLLVRLEEHAWAVGLPLLRLETGVHQRAAIRLYERHGFTRTGPFGSYRDDPNSLFLEKAVATPDP
jgi:putative acetyltransferase